MKDMKIAGANPDIKLIACDMDGTLLDKNGSISPAARELIWRLADYGIVFSHRVRPDASPD
ncbi:MAG: HAD family hydrolase, partial [Hungatella hathewayi]